MSHLIMQQNQMMSVQGQVNITLYRRSFNTTYLYYYYYLCYTCTGAVILKAILSEMHRINYKNISRNKLHS